MWVGPKDKIRSTFKNDIGKDNHFSSCCDQTLECYGVGGSHCTREQTQTLVLSLLSPFYLIWDLSPCDGATHIWTRSLSSVKPFY